MEKSAHHRNTISDNRKRESMLAIDGLGAGAAAAAAPQVDIGGGGRESCRNNVR